MRSVNRPRPARPARAAMLLAVLPVLVACGACGAGPGSGGATGHLSYVASFRPGWGSPDERKYVLTSAAGPRVVQLPSEPPHAAPGPPLAGPGPPTAATQAPVTTPPVSPADCWTPAPAISWVNGGQYLAVITYGSGSCPDGPQSIDVVATQEIEVHVGPLFPGRDPCTADLSAYVTVVDLPQSITPTKPLVARFGERTVTIPAASG